MYSKPSWSVSEWGSQVVDANNNVILTAPDFISPENSEYTKGNVLLASFAPDMLRLIEELIKKDLISNETGKKIAEDFLKKIFSKL